MLRRLLELVEKLLVELWIGETLCVGAGSGSAGGRATVGSEDRRAEAGIAWMLRLEPPPRIIRVPPLVDWLTDAELRFDLGSRIGAAEIFAPVLLARW
jgi:hypothetical protein